MFRALLLACCASYKVRLAARWQSGYAAACKAVDGGSTPPRASNFLAAR